MITGDTLLGFTSPLSGSIHNLSVKPFADSGTVSFLHIAPNQTEQEIGIFLNGQLHQTIVGGDGFAGVANLTDGQQSINAFTNYLGDAWAPFDGDVQGNRAFLSWERSAAQDVVAYQVYWDEGGGGSPSIMLDQVDEILIPQAINTRGGSPTGGRITFYGIPETQKINDVLTVTIKNDGTYDCIGNGISILNEPWKTAQTLALPYGVRVIPQDLPEAYGLGQVFAIPVGPRNNFLTGQLEPGTYKFRICAIDAAYNKSDFSSVQEISILEVPPALENVKIEWDADVNELIVSWDISTPGIDRVRLYSNLDKAGWLYNEVVTEENPMYDTVFSNGQINIPYEADGLMKFYLRPVNAVGIERKDVFLYESNFPPKPGDLNIVLGPPSNLRARQVAGNVIVSWVYRFMMGDDLQRFEFYQDDVEADVWNNEHIVSIVGNSESPVEGFTVSILTPIYTPVYFGVKAIGKSGLEVKSEIIRLDIDNDAPDAPSEVYGIAH